MDIQKSYLGFSTSNINILIDHPLFNAIWFNVFWLCAVVGQGSFLLLTLALLLVHFLLVDNRVKEISQVLVIAPVGIGIDTLLSHQGFYHFANDELIPLWLCLLWVAFSITVSRSLFFLSRYPIIAMIVGSIGGMMSYFAGNRLEAVDFGEPVFKSLIVIAIIWGVIFPVFLLLTKRLQGKKL